MALGAFPDVSLAQARDRHREGRKLLASGADPMAERKAAKLQAKAADTESFQSVARLWWEHWRTGKSKRHADTTWERLEKNVLPVLGARPVREVEGPNLVTIGKRVHPRPRRIL